MKETWLRQRKELRKIAEKEGLDLPLVPLSFSALRDFSEAILRCSDRSAIELLFRQEPERAAGFVKTLEQMEEILLTAEVELPGKDR